MPETTQGTTYSSIGSSPADAAAEQSAKDFYSSMGDRGNPHTGSLMNLPPGPTAAAFRISYEPKEKEQGGQKQLGEDKPAWGTGYGYLPHGETKES